ncbi:MAG: Fe-S cluster assembly sulfur transfer protein SufU [Bacillales bacterium]
MLTLDNNLMRQIIMDHYKNPRFKKDVTDNIEGYYSIRMDSTSCIDDITLYIKINKENTCVDDIFFTGIGCAISISSADIMCELFLNKNIEDIQTIHLEFMNMLMEKEYNKDILEEALVFKNTSKQLSRIKCASLAWEGINKIIKDLKNNER